MLLNGIKRRIERWIDSRVEMKYNINAPFEYGVKFREGMYSQYKTKENEVLFSSDSILIEYFYKITPNPWGQNTSNQFWSKVSGQYPRKHSGLPKAISNAMAGVLFNEAPKIYVENETVNEKLQEILENIDIEEVLQKSAIMESYSGEVAFKLVLDSEISQYPIVQMYEASKFSVERKYGKVVNIIFHDYYKHNKSKYRLDTIAGMGYIDYVLYNDDDKREVPLGTIPETRNLKPFVINGTDGKPIRKLLGVYKRNKVSNVYDSERSESDYSGLYERFDSLDEIISTMVDYVRKGKITTFISDNLLQEDANTRKQLPINDYTINDVILKDFDPESKFSLLERSFPELNLQPYIDTIKSETFDILTKAGLSPASLGLDNAGGNASAEAISIREKVTMRTRDAKLSLWRKALNDLTQLLLIFNDIYELNEYESGATHTATELYTDEVFVDFANYTSTDFETKARTMLVGLDRLWDIEYAVNSLFADEMSKEDIEEMIGRLRVGGIDESVADTTESTREVNDRAREDNS